MSEGTYIRRPNRVLGVYAFVFLIVLYVPILLIPVFSLNDSIYVRFPLQGFTTQWYGELMARDAVWQALYASLRVGIVVSVVSTLLGLLAARAIARYRMPGRGALTTFVMLPLVVPGIIFGVALLVFVSSMGVGLSLYTVALGHLIVCLPFSVATLLPRFESFDESLIEASAVLGETPLWTFWRVTLPNVLPGVVASLLLCFTISFDEFIMAFFLSGTQATLPMYIWTQLRFPRELPSVLALSSLILLVSFALVALSLTISRMGAVEERK
jgi:spermidine/putrescine transport system permease protein